MTELWSYRDTVRVQSTDVVGFEVVATDGAIGKVDAATYDAEASYLVVDTGTVDLRQEADAARRGDRADRL